MAECDGLRLEKTPRQVALTFTVPIHVGYSTCGICRQETPGPTKEQLEEFTEKFLRWALGNKYDHRAGRFMWPGDDDYMPAGWRHAADEWQCPDCIAEMEAAVARRRQRSK